MAEQITTAAFEVSISFTIPSGIDYLNKNSQTYINAYLANKFKYQGPSTKSYFTSTQITGNWSDNVYTATFGFTGLSNCNYIFSTTSKLSLSGFVTAKPEYTLTNSSAETSLGAENTLFNSGSIISLETPNIIPSRILSTLGISDPGTVAFTIEDNAVTLDVQYPVSQGFKTAFVDTAKVSQLETTMNSYNVANLDNNISASYVSVSASDTYTRSSSTTWPYVSGESTLTSTSTESYTVTNTKAGVDISVYPPSPRWEYDNDCMMTIPAQASTFTGTCIPVGQSGSLMHDITVSYSGSISTWINTVTSMNEAAYVSYTLRPNESGTQSFTINRYYDRATTTSHCSMEVTYTGSSSLIYQTTSEAVGNMSSTTEIRSITRI